MTEPISDEELTKLRAELHSPDGYFEVDGNMGYEFGDVDATVDALIARLDAAEEELRETRRELALTEDECLDQQRRADQAESLLTEELTKPVQYGNFTAEDIGKPVELFVDDWLSP